MAKKLTRNKMLKKYESLYSHIPENKEERLKYIIEYLKLTEKNFESIKNKIDYINNIEDKTIEYTLFELPMPSDRPRTNFKFKKFFVNNAKSNMEFIRKKLKELKVDYDFISTPTTFILKFFLPIPPSMPKEEKYLAELQYISAIQKPDNDNVYKTYTDMINQLILMDDYLITKIIVEKYYSFKPRVEVCIQYKKSFDCKYNERKIKKSKFYIEEIEKCKILKIRF